jgi:hypothetical protein
MHHAALDPEVLGSFKCHAHEQLRKVGVMEFVQYLAEFVVVQVLRLYPFPQQQFACLADKKLLE